MNQFFRTMTRVWEVSLFSICAYVKRGFGKCLATGPSEHDNKSLGSRAFKMLPMGCHETSVNNCQSTLSNIEEERRFRTLVSQERPLSRKLVAMSLKKLMQIERRCSQPWMLICGAELYVWTDILTKESYLISNWNPNTRAKFSSVR